MSVHAEPISHSNCLTEQQLCEIEEGQRCRQLWAAVLLDAIEPRGVAVGGTIGGFLTDETGAWAHSRRLICDAAGVDHDAFLRAVRQSRALEPPLTEAVLRHLRLGRATAPEIACALGLGQDRVRAALGHLKTRGLVCSDPHGWMTRAAPPRRATAAKPKPQRDVLRRGLHSRTLRVLEAWSIGETCALADIQQRTGLSELHVRQAVTTARRGGHIFTNTALRTFRRDR